MCISKTSKVPLFLKSYQLLNDRLESDKKFTDIPKCEILSDLINECVVFNCSTLNKSLEPEKVTIKKSIQKFSQFNCLINKNLF